MKIRLGSVPLVTAAALVTCLSTSPRANADGPIFRHAANFFQFGGGEFFTATTAAATANSSMPGSPDGALFYRKTITVQEGSNTLYVSLYTTSDQHQGAALWLSCRVNGLFCRPSVGGANEAPSGWINLQRLPQNFNDGNGGHGGPNGASPNCNNGGRGTADCHDNGVAYEWCIPVRGGSTVTVDLKMATSTAGDGVFIEKGHVYIDSSFIRQPNRCMADPEVTPDDPEMTAEMRAAQAAGEEVAGTTTQQEQ
jgi:hypothetical protein